MTVMNIFCNVTGLPKPRKEDELAEATTAVRNHQHSVMDPPASEEVKKNVRDVQTHKKKRAFF
jgi:hypothetical protein